VGGTERRCTFYVVRSTKGSGQEFPPPPFGGRNGARGGCGTPSPHFLPQERSDISSPVGGGVAEGDGGGSGGETGRRGTGFP